MLPSVPSDRPLVLAFDTSTSTASVAVGRGAEALAEVHAAVPRAYEEGLVPRIVEALSCAGVGIRDVEVVACGRGPGSFTGLRIAMATAKGYAFALGRPLVIVSSTGATALGARAPSVVVALDAKRGQLFLEAFAVDRTDASRPLRAVASATLDAAATAGWIAGLGLPGPVALVGEAAGPASKSCDAVSYVITDESVVFPQGRDLLLLADVEVTLGAFANPDSVEPEYLRAPPFNRPRGEPRALRRRI